MKGLDLSKFTKVGSNDTHTTFKHKDGHWIKVAHGGLTEKMRKSIECLPMALGGEAIHKETDTKGESKAGENVRLASGSSSQKEKEQYTEMAKNQNYKVLGQMHADKQDRKYMADGGDPEAAETGAAIGGSEGAPDQPMLTGDPSTPSTQDTSTIPMQEGSPTAPAPVSTPNSAPVPENSSPTDVPPQPTQTQASGPIATKQFLQDEENNTAHDLMMGHIKPETYHDLYAKQDTLGKIGTLFGMMVGGFGSGLTHQPNVLLGMMDKTIERDLDAQKTSAANAQNFWRLNQANLANNAQVKKLGADTNAVNQSISYNQMAQATFHSLIKKVQAMPEGPQKVAAMQAAMLVANGMQGKLMNMQDQAAATAGAINPSVGGQPTSPQTPSVPTPPQGSTQEGIKSILHPGAQSMLNGMQLNPVMSKDYPEVMNQFTTAQQADKALKNLDANFGTMNEHTSVGQHLENMTSPIGGIIGSVVHDPIKGMARATDEGEKYYSAQSGIVGDLRAAFPNLSGEELERIVSSNSPQRGDSPDILRQKKEAIEGFIKRSVPTSMLKKYHLSGE